MPGPVEIHPSIQAAFQRPPKSHRSLEFTETFESVRSVLQQMTSARHVALMNGSGTLANEAVASCLEGPGIVLVNGEFGARLARQAARWNLPVRTLEWSWGQAWDLDQLEATLPGVSWVWGTHLETSTGMVNDMPAVAAMAKARGVRACFDCVSSLGAVPLDLQNVWLASGVSGKALGSFAGVAMVFASEVPKLNHLVPTYLDLAAAIETEGPCFTFPTPLMDALEVALRRERNYEPLGGLVRERLRSMGVEPLVEGAVAAPVVTTFAPPHDGFLARCLQFGYCIGGESGYLAARGLVQIATMGAVASSHINHLFDLLA
jgi:aspartate aminotransferase-like enzyme